MTATSSADLWLDVLAWQTIAAAFAIARQDDNGEYLAIVSGKTVLGLCDARLQYTPFDAQRGRLKAQQLRVGRLERRDGGYSFSVRTLDGVRRRVDLCLRCATASRRSYQRALARERRTA